MNLAKTQLTASFFVCIKIKDKVYPNGIHNLEFLLVQRKGAIYPLFENSKMLRGKYKNQIKFRISSDNYTNEHHRRKTKYKFASGRNAIGHISKMLPLGNSKFYGDVKGTNDKLLFKVVGDFEKLILVVIPNSKHDHSLNNDFADGLISDNEIGL